MTSLEDHVERIAIKGTALDSVGSGRQGEPLTFALRFTQFRSRMIP